MLAFRVRTQIIGGAKAPVGVYKLLSLDSHSGKVKDNREFLTYGSLRISRRMMRKSSFQGAM